MIGQGYWATGITVDYVEDLGWGVSADFYDGGFADDNPAEGRVSTEGVLRSRYRVGDLTAAVKVLEADVERLGIPFRNSGGGPALYAEFPEDKSGWPRDWVEQVEAAAAAVGFEPVGTGVQEIAR
jgi:hypothetical protein